MKFTFPRPCRYAGQCVGQYLDGCLQHCVDRLCVRHRCSGTTYHHTVKTSNDRRQANLPSRNLELRDVRQPYVVGSCDSAGFSSPKCLSPPRPVRSQSAPIDQDRSFLPRDLTISRTSGGSSGLVGSGGKTRNFPRFPSLGWMA